MYSRITRHSSLLVFLALAAAAAWSGVAYEPGPFYAALAKPAWAPPDRAFPAVWAGLAVLTALAGAIVWRAQGLGPAFWLWLLQLALGAAWPWLMFGEKRILHALIDMGALWLVVLAFVLAAWPVRRSASLLLVPSLVWVSYLVALNFAIWRLNA